MKYFLFALSAYLVLGLYLTRSILKTAPTIKLRFKDYAIGAFLMPLVLLLALLLTLFEKAWARLLIALDFDPPENMRAGPDTSDSGDSKKT